jgi:hypothetical protein
MSDNLSILIEFNCQILEQALRLVTEQQVVGAPPFRDKIGPHLRHIVEHYEALARPAEPGLVDYDSRARDRALESDPRLAVVRIQALMHSLSQSATRQPREPLQVSGQIGLCGDFNVVADTSFARELMFLASHAVHHFALLKPYCDEHGLLTAESFGKAPATLAHEKLQRVH